MKGETRGGKYRASRSAKRLARSIATSLESINFPKGSSYNEIKILTDSLPRTISQIASARQRWEDQTNPFFLLTMRRLRIGYDRLVELTREVRDFFDNRYDKTRRVEETIEMTTEVKRLNTEVETILAFKEKTQHELTELDKKLGIIQERLTELEKTPFATKLHSTEEEVEEAEKRIYSRLSSLQRPIKKIKFLVKRGRLDISPEATDLLKGCNNRIDIRQIEHMGIKSFRLLMNTIREAVESNRISLKKEERTRVVETLGTLLDERIIESKIEERQNNEENREKLLLSDEGKAYQSRRLDLEREREGLKRERLRSLERLESIKNRLQESQLEIEGTKRRIKKNIHDLLGEEIDIQVG